MLREHSRYSLVQLHQEFGRLDDISSFFFKLLITFKKYLFPLLSHAVFVSVTELGEGGNSEVESPLLLL